MLSSRTKDEVTARAMQQLKESGLTVSHVNTLSEHEVAQLIYPVGFWRVSNIRVLKTTDDNVMIIVELV